MAEYGSITITPEGAATISVDLDGAAAFTDATGATPISLPAEITARTSFWVKRREDYTVIVTSDGVEIDRRVVGVGGQPALDPEFTVRTSDVSLGEAQSGALSGDVGTSGPAETAYLSLSGSASGTDGSPGVVTWASPADQQPGTDVVLDPVDFTLINVLAGTYLFTPTLVLFNGSPTKGQVDLRRVSGTMVIPYDGVDGATLYINSERLLGSMFMAQFTTAGSLHLRVVAYGDAWEANVGVDVRRIA